LVDDPSNNLPEDEADKERAKLFRIIEKLILWENSNNERVWSEAREAIRKSTGNLSLDLLDPFCGGGSIPLEAQRLGLRSYASDLNPVAVLITKSMIEIPPRFAGRSPVNPGTIGNSDSSYPAATGLAADVEYYGRLLREEAEARIGHLYPRVDNRKVIAWIWTRTVKCPNPACGAEMPLARTFELSSQGQGAFVEPVVDKERKSVGFVVRIGKNRAHKGTVNRKGACCIVCESPVAFKHIRAEGKSGRMSRRLMAIVAESDKTATFSSPIEHHIDVANGARSQFRPEEEIPLNRRDFKPPIYGMMRFADLFTERQLIALSTFCDLIGEVHSRIAGDAIRSGFTSDSRGFDDGGVGAKAYADAIVTYLTFALDRSVNYWSSFTPWGGSFIVQTFGRQVIPMVWDYAEANPFSDRTGNWLGAINWITNCMKRSFPAKGIGRATQLDVANSLYPDINPIICTDPPYYSNITYADLSDFFYIWMRRALGKIYPKLFDTLLTPKASEIVAAPYRFDGSIEKADEHFLSRLSKAFELIRIRSHPDFPVTIFYAFKESEEDSDESGTKSYASKGWEAMLEGLMSAGFQINGTWPMRTERDQGLKTGTNVLASSIVLVCRPRSPNASLATRKEFIATLKRELPESLRQLQHSSIAPVDLAQAAIGPGMAVYSRYAKVLEADGLHMNVKTALQIINQELDVYLNTQESEFDQDTQFCTSWFDQYGMQAGPFGEANVLARAKNTSVQALSNGLNVESKGGKVRLLKREELSETLDLTKHERLSIWMVTQVMISKLETGGENEAARLTLKIGGGISERAKDLAYRMYSICERRGFAEEALAYNHLVVSWHSIREKAGMSAPSTDQMKLEV
jgi:putative DNA methylase